MKTNNTDNKVELIYDDYAQSANTLFHFMKKEHYLEEILLKKAIVPRYCKENLEYLKIKNGETIFKEVMVLQKCFCDIPFHKLTESFPLHIVGDLDSALNEIQKELLPTSYTHPDLYGKYGIAFSKRWGEKNNLQPVHYLNEESQFTEKFSNLIQQILIEEDVPDEFCDDILNRLCFIKPLRGTMKRRFEKDNLEIELQKNFHDEKEWRYVPTLEVASRLKKSTIIANPSLIKMNGKDSDVNRGLNEEEYSDLWLKYSYEDVRYIIVPNNSARISIINTIMSIPKEKFNNQEDMNMQKYVLVSKILVLDEIRKDW